MVTAVASFLGIRELFVKIGIGLMTLLAIGFAVWGVIKWYDTQIDDAFSRGEASAYAHATARTNAITNRINSSAGVIKDRTNAKIITVVRDAADLRVRGPGKASCPSFPDPSSGGPDTTASKAGDPLGGLPPTGRTDFTAVPWDDFVTLVEQHDRLLIEAEAWREDYQTRSKIIAEEQK